MISHNHRWLFRLRCTCNSAMTVLYIAYIPNHADIDLTDVFFLFLLIIKQVAHTALLKTGYVEFLPWHNLYSV
jgi:hypothetical protein